MVTTELRAQTAQAVRAQIAQAVRHGTCLEEIERTLIEPTPLGADEKSALWLYAQALDDRPAIAHEPVLAHD